MRPYAPNTGAGRRAARDNVHHRTADKGEPRAAFAKALRHAARQEARKIENEARARSNEEKER